MNLYKTRDFSAFFSDTIEFFKKHGAHFLKNYILINGVLLLISLLAFLPILNLFVDFNSFELRGDGNIKNLFLDNLNSGVFFIYFGLLFISSIFINSISNSFTPIYLKLFQEKNGSNFSVSDIVNSLKDHFPKIIKYIIGMTILMIPLSIVFLIAIILVACTLVGIFIPIAVFMMLGMFTMFEYYHKPENRFFSSFSYAWELIKLKFWHSVGCVALFMLVIGIIQQIFSSVFELILDVNSGELLIQNNFEFTSTMISTLLISMTFSIIISFITNSIMMLNQGIIFYSLKGEKEGVQTYNSIDEIGTGE